MLIIYILNRKNNKKKSVGNNERTGRTALYILYIILYRYIHIQTHTHMYEYIHTYIYIQSIDVGKLTNFCRAAVVYVYDIIFNSDFAYYKFRTEIQN